MTVLAVTAATAGLIQAQPATAKPETPKPTAPASRTTSAKGAVNTPDTTLGNGWKTSADRAVTTAADSDGLHLLVADSNNAYAWKTLTVLSEPQLPADTWIGNSCVMDDHHAAVVYAPRTFTDKPDLMMGGAFTAVVNLDDGSVTKLPFTASLAYFDPTCNPATHTAVFTALRDARTRLVTVNIKGATVADTSANGEITSAVPTKDGAIAAAGNQLVHVDRKGRTTRLAATKHAPYGIRVTADGTISYIDRTGDTDADVQTYAHGKKTTVASGRLTAMNLSQGTDGTVYLTGKAGHTKALAASGIKPLNVSPDAEVSTRGRLAVDPVVSPAVKTGMTRIANAGRGFTKSASKEPAAEVTHGRTSHELTITGTVPGTGRHTKQTAAEPDSTAGATPSPALTGSSKPHLSTTSTMTPSTDDPRAHDPVDTDAWCSVPRNDVNNQALQPTPNQVEWAVDMAVRNDLRAGYLIQGGWRSQTGLGNIDPQGMFPAPTLNTGGRIPAQVELGILAQESNLWQAESGSISGQMGNPLAAVDGYYGHQSGGTLDDYWTIHWNKSDCGYGVGQVTDGMRKAGYEKPGETSLPVSTQRAIAIDYATNIAASLHILADKWNEVHQAGQTIAVNNDDPAKPENWFTAVWNYNLGFNKKADAGTNGNWGLGWYNNPANPVYPASREAFMNTDVDPLANRDAAHPQYWPYEEKVMGWAAWSIDTGHSYATSGRQDWPGESGFSSAGFRPAYWNGADLPYTVRGSARYNRAHVAPPLDTFCNTKNNCDTANPPHCPDAACYAQYWWHESNATWKSDCATTCGFESIKYQTLVSEPGRGTRLQYGTPDCSGAPNGAIVVDDVPQGTNTWSSCGTTKTAGSFQFTFYPDPNATGPGLGQYDAKADLHQIGGGYQGHFWYAHVRDTDHLGGDGGRMTTVGDWKLNSPLPQDQGKVYVHIPDTGAQTTEADYQILTPSGTWEKKISQDANESNKWVSLGAYHFDGQAPEVRLSNANSFGSGDDDIAWDAVAFVPGDFDTMPSITLPPADPDAPDPDAPDDPQTIPQKAGASLAAKGLVLDTCASMAPTATGACIKVLPASKGFTTKAVEKLRQRTSAAVRRAPSASDDARTAAATVDDSLCTALQGGRNFTRFASCVVQPAQVDQKQNGTVIASETFVLEQTISLAVNNTQVKQTLSLTPYSATPDIGEVSLNVEFDCLSDCGAPTPSWSSPALWATAADTHTATATATTSWTQSTGYSNLHLSWTLSGTINGGATDTSTWDEPALTVRCDNEFSGRNAGCVFPQYTPTYEVNTKAYPAAAALYWVLEQKLSNHPGSKAHNMPLHRLQDTDLQQKNRDIMCQASVAKWQPNPNTPDASCDEYAFAASRESGGMQPGITSGSECVQIYATQVGTQWTLKTDPRYPVPDWTVPCGRGSIPSAQNTGAGGGLGRWTGKMRVRDGDAYYVDEPGFAGCDPDTVCTVNP
ncbi:golvesin C-terminal-like domain-containing protein [Streptomyces sp. DSM 118148]|uniref:golvesin C-terminal-like domain-containing protein n=1 Tax=Streptomyces sp. DSM 118148 TaxID=3448667 RepID=UPI004040280A